jgi:hypothetical protein
MIERSNMDRLQLEDLALSPEGRTLERLLAVLTQQSQDDALIRRLADLLATFQAPEVLDRFATSPIPANLWEYVIHELVIKGVTISSYQNLSQIARVMHEHYHPLSVLPLKLMSSEAEMYPYRRQYNNANISVPFGAYENKESPFVLPDKPSEISVDETTTPGLRTRLQSAFENWENESNGRIEARQFTAHKSLSPDLITNTGLLLDLNLDCLEGTSLNNVSVWNTSSQQVINHLFYGAANGGAYNHGIGNVYGRLRAWKSIAALINKPESTPITTLNEALDHVEWFELLADSSWFHHVMWDEFIIALSEDRQVLTVLAATDID